MPREYCTHCGAKITQYKYSIDDLNVSTLLKFKKAVVQLGRYKINVKTEIPDLTQGERFRMTQLRFHGLVAKVKNEDDKQIPNMWLLTSRGQDFVEGVIDVPKWVMTFRNRVVKHSIETVNIRSFRMLSDFGPTYEQKPIDTAKYNDDMHDLDEKLSKKK